jgi:hypothetical protein
MSGSAGQPPVSSGETTTRFGKLRRSEIFRLTAVAVLAAGAVILGETVFSNGHHHVRAVPRRLKRGYEPPCACGLRNGRTPRRELAVLRGW